MRSFRLDTATGVRVLQLSEVSAHGDRPASHERAISRGACPVARRNDVRKIQGRRTDRARHNPHPHRSRATQPRAVPNRVNASCRGARPEKTRAAQLRVKLACQVALPALGRGWGRWDAVCVWVRRDASTSSQRRRRLRERRAIRESAARARRPRHHGERATKSACACRSSGILRHPWSAPPPCAGRVPAIRPRKRGCR